MGKHFNKRNPLDISALVGTVASLVAFVIMGWLVHNLMWRPIEAQKIESVGPEEPAAPTLPATPRKTNSGVKFTA
jgi:hypothetical protein